MLSIEVSRIINELQVIKGEPHTYTLDLEHGTKYVGCSFNIKNRLKQHFSGRGSEATKEHKPISINNIEKHEGLSRKELLNEERILYHKLKEVYGAENVRGAGNVRKFSINKTPRTLRKRSRPLRKSAFELSWIERTQKSKRRWIQHLKETKK